MTSANPENLPQEITPQTAEALPAVSLDHGHPVVTSLQVAEHFGKRHGDVIRSVKRLGCSEEFSRRNFASSDYVDDRGKVQPSYLITRDGFALLAMGFTGKEAMRWKEAYIRAFNLMEAKLRELYVAPLLGEKEFRAGVRLKAKLTLMEQGNATLRQLRTEPDRHVRRNLYWQLRQINDTLGIPTEGMAVLLGPDAPELAPSEEGGAA